MVLQRGIIASSLEKLAIHFGNCNSTAARSASEILQGSNAFHRLKFLSLDMYPHDPKDLISLLRNLQCLEVCLLKLRNRYDGEELTPSDDPDVNDDYSNKVSKVMALFRLHSINSFGQAVPETCPRLQELFVSDVNGWEEAADMLELRCQTELAEGCLPLRDVTVLASGSTAKDSTLQRIETL